VTYLIAEIGQNHQGSLQTAKDLVDMVSEPSPHAEPGDRIPGVDAVKLTRRDLAHELDESSMMRFYDDRNSFGDRYWQHRSHLELDVYQHCELYWYAKDRGLDFVETLCHSTEIDRLLRVFTPDAVKVASRDLHDTHLIHDLAGTGLPLILSTGMSDREEIDRAVEAAGPADDLTLLYCVSKYPTDYADLDLRCIQTLKDRYGVRVGFSDHTIGPYTPAKAVLMGAEVVEKHVTLDRGQRGSDHVPALERDGVYRMVRDVRETESMLGTGELKQNPASALARQRLRVGT